MCSPEHDVGRDRTRKGNEECIEVFLGHWEPGKISFFMDSSLDFPDSSVTQSASPTVLRPLRSLHCFAYFVGFAR